MAVQVCDTHNQGVCLSDLLFRLQKHIYMTRKYIVIDHEEREIICLVVTVCLSVCLSVCLGLWDTLTLLVNLVFWRFFEDILTKFYSSRVWVWADHLNHPWVFVDPVQPDEGF